MDDQVKNGPAPEPVPVFSQYYGPNDIEMRIDCLRIAAGNLASAKELYAWVKGGT